MGAPTLNRKLKDLRVQYMQSGTWVLYEKYQNKGYTKTKTHTYNDNGKQKTAMLTVWTEKGRLFIHSLLNHSISSKPKSNELWRNAV
jgi:anti-repressor protein